MMLRSREFKWYLVIMAAIFAAGLLAGRSLPQWWPVIFCIVSAALAASGVFYAVYRCRKIKDLAGYLGRIQNGGDSLDVRDNREGELSILKNELYKLTQKLTEQAELLSKDKAWLAGALSDISHQLKTPVTSMLVLTELLKDEGLPRAKRREFLRKLENQLGRMEWLISTLLKMSRLDAGAVTLKKERLSVKQLLERAAEPVLIPMELKEQEFQIEGDGNAVLYGDREWLSEALSNILKNCMEHTPVGGRITASYEENALYTKIELRDTGKGISKEDLPHIFERFYKGKNSSSDSVGIGLAFAKQTVGLLNGTLEAGNGEAGGTVFTLKLYKDT